MSWKEDDTDDSDKPWSDPEGEGWKGEVESEEPSPEEVARYADCGDLMIESDFLILQMLASGKEHQDIAPALNRTVPEIADRVEAIKTFILEWWECDEEDMPDLMADISRYGQHTPCQKKDCPVRLQKVDPHCFKCGTRNPNFDLRHFWLVNGLTLSEVRKVECKGGHHIQKAQQIPHCELCGILLNPDAQTSPD